MSVYNWRQLLRTQAPSWLTDDQGGLVGYVVDVLKDALTDRVRLGLLARFPQNGPNGETAPADALSAMGRDRRVVRGINETDQSYAARLVAWLDDRQTAGNPFALMKKLSEYTGAGPSFRTVDVQGNWYSRDASGNQTINLQKGNWDWDADVSGTRWSRFWVIIYPNGLWTQWNWADVGRHWGDTGLTWGSTATPEQVATVRSLVADWKPGGTTCVNIILAFDPTSFNPTGARDGAGLPDGNWSVPAKQSGGLETYARLTTACYWDGV